MLQHVLDLHAEILPENVAYTQGVCHSYALEDLPCVTYGWFRLTA